jgi:hypothetical protein
MQSLPSEIGVVDFDDIFWRVDDLTRTDLLSMNGEDRESRSVVIAGDGWRRIEDLRKARVASSFAFFARRFNNDGLDDLFEKCLFKAVEKAAGMQLRIARKRPG